MQLLGLSGETLTKMEGRMEVIMMEINMKDGNHGLSQWRDSDVLDLISICGDTLVQAKLEGSYCVALAITGSSSGVLPVLSLSWQGNCFFMVIYSACPGGILLVKVSQKCSLDQGCQTFGSIRPTG